MTTSSVPILPRNYVPRLRLWRRLDDTADSAVTLLVGPVGSGKTLGVSGWLRDRGHDGSGGAVWLHADHSWTAQRLARVLDDAAPQAPGQDPRRVVIDDAQALPASTMRLIDERLRDAPRSIRLLLASRWDLSLTRLMPELLGDLSVIRGDILKMDDDEAAAVVAPHVGTRDPAVINALIDRGKGWCAVLVLTARAVAGSSDPVVAARRLPHRGAAVADQVASEVFSALSARQRHLLLCVAGEEVVSASTAARLSNDRNAAQVLAELEITGLLVGRIPSTEDVVPSGTPAANDAERLSANDPRYLIHPLLAEVVRRLLSVDGVDVARARAAVVRAVRLELAQGHASQSLRRLLRVNALGAAADVLARGGVYMVLSRGSGAEVAEFSRHHPEMIEAHPATWFPVALERWLANDMEGARHWADRIVHESTRSATGSTSPGRGSPPRVLIGDDPTISGGPHTPTWDAQVAIVRLWRARLGLEPIYAAVGHARRVALSMRSRQASSDVDSVLLPVLLEELGVAQNWLGELNEAEGSLTIALALARSEGLFALAASCMSHLALTQFMAGREHAAVEVATEALGLLGSEEVWRIEFAPTRAALSLFLGGIVDVPWSTDAIVESHVETGRRAHGADLCTRFWMRLRDARLALFGGSIADAERIVASPVESPLLRETFLPEHLRVVVLVGRALLAAMSADDEVLRSVEDELLNMGAHGESRFVAGLRADCRGDRRSALAAFNAASADTVYSQPPTRELALTCEAQLLDTLGEPELALERLAQAASLTEVRRNADPFLGWSRQGTPIATLLERLDRQTSSSWVHALALANAGTPDLISRFESATALRHEKKEPVGPLVGPTLSPREREVLGELARGSTYADIGAALYVSENTVKTHVSSLYGKLGVSRRSEALAVARANHLL